MGDRMGNNPTAEHADAYALGRSFEKSYRDGRHHRSGAAGARGGTVRAVQQHRVPLDRCGAPGRAAGRVVARLRDGEFEIGGRIPVNPSGGTLCTNAIAVTAMARVAEVALQVWGRAGEHQVKGARLGIASGNGGDHQIFGTMVIEA